MNASSTEDDAAGEVPVAPATVLKALGVAQDAVLLGGQALAWWVARLDVPMHTIPAPRAYISGDIDFLGALDDVKRFAQALRGEAILPPRRAITALVGQVRARAGARSYFGVDVIHRVVGVDADRVRRNAIEFTLRQPAGVSFKVIEPVDLLLSRLENLRQLEEKRNAVGVWQAELAILVCHAYIEDMLARDNEKQARNAATAIGRMAAHATAIQAARAYGLEVLAAVPAGHFSHDKFRQEQWPRMVAAVDKKISPEERTAARRARPF
jgi:hypothetical protein